MKKDQDLFFIANYSAKVDQKKAETELNNVSKMFISSYFTELDAFHGNVKPFKEFDKTLHEAMDKYWILI
jgi:hypothetical protein